MATTHNVGFRLGLQSAADAIIANKSGAEEGSFYLTSDSHRLYIGAPSTENANNITLYSVNEGVITVSSLDVLPALTPGSAAAKAATGTFYYITSENILAVFNGHDYIQINQDTDNSIKTAAFTGKKTSGKEEVEITHTITDAQENPHTSKMLFAADGGLKIDFDTTTKKLTIHGDTYTLSTSAATNGAKININSQNDSTKTSAIQIVGKNDVTVSQKDNVITIDHTDTHVAKAQFNNTATGVELKLIDNLENEMAKAAWNPYIAYGQGSGSSQLKAQFVQGTAYINVYSKAEIDQLMQDLNGMTYKGTMKNVNTGGASYATNIKFTTTGNYIIGLDGTTEMFSKIGDMIVLGEDMTFKPATGENVSYSKGTIIICRSKDGTEMTSGSHIGFIDPAKLEFDIIASSVNTDTTYRTAKPATDGKHGMRILNSFDTSVGELLLEQEALGTIKNADGSTRTATGANIVLKSDYKANTTGGYVATIKLAHEIVVRNDSKTAALTQVGSADLTFDAVTGVVTDDTGHITGVKTTTITVKDTQLTLKSSQYTGSEYTATNGDEVVVVKNTIKAKNAVDTEQSISGSFTVSSGSLSVKADATHGSTAANTNLLPGLSIDMVWGSF